MSFSSWFRRQRLTSPSATFPTMSSRRCGRGPATLGRRRQSQRPFHLELLEDRQLLSGDLGAALVADIVPGIASSRPEYLANVNDTLYFAATDASGDAGLWTSDGTTAGTRLIQGGLGGAPGDFTSFNGAIYFSSIGLWKTDGTAAGTLRLNTMYASNLTTVGDTLFLSGAEWDVRKGIELWKSDGTAAGTKLVKDIYTGTSKDGGRTCLRNCSAPNDSSPEWLTELNGKLLFTATDAKNGRELWVSDGTSRGTRLVKDIVPGGASSNPQHLVQFGERVFFGAAGGLWATNGTKDGTVLVKALAESPSYLAEVGDSLYFSSGWQLWKSDGITAGVVEDLGFGAENLTNVNGRLYFTGSDGVHGEELWQHDTASGVTEMVMDIYPGSAGSSPMDLTAMSDKLYFAATDPAHGRELWDPPAVEPEDVDLAAGEDDFLLVTSYDTDSVLRYDAQSGQFVDEFVPKFSGGMNRPYGAIFGPDGNLYVTSGQFGPPGQLQAVLRYDGQSGAFIDAFAGVGELENPRGLIFGPDGDLYVADHSGGTPAGRVLRFDGITGEYEGDFVPAGEDGPNRPQGLFFGPRVKNGPGADGSGKLDLYVGSAATHSIRRYDGQTGEYLGEFVSSGSSGIGHPTGMTLGPDGNLYVANLSLGASHNAVFRYQGPGGKIPGAFIDEFVPVGSGELQTPFGVLFGPDGNGDGKQDLYVTSAQINLQSYVAYHDTSSVKRYDGVTGAFIDTFVGLGSGGLDNPSLITFTRTDPTTLAYTADSLIAVAMPSEPVTETLGANQPQPLLSDSIALSRADGVETSALTEINSGATHLSGTTPSRASEQTIWGDTYAAGGTAVVGRATVEDFDNTSVGVPLPPWQWETLDVDDVDALLASDDNLIDMESLELLAIALAGNPLAL
jgi:ELWxxDGT repeat protein